MFPAISPRNSPLADSSVMEPVSITHEIVRTINGGCGLINQYHHSLRWALYRMLYLTGATIAREV